MCDSTPKPGEPLLDNMAVLLSGRASFELVEFSVASFLNVNTPADLKAAGRLTATMKALGSGSGTTPKPFGLRPCRTT